MQPTRRKMSYRKVTQLQFIFFALFQKSFLFSKIFFSLLIWVGFNNFSQLRYFKKRNLFMTNLGLIRMKHCEKVTKHNSFQLPDLEIAICFSWMLITKQPAMTYKIVKARSEHCSFNKSQTSASTQKLEINVFFEEINSFLGTVSVIFACLEEGIRPLAPLLVVPLSVSRDMLVAQLC